MLASNFNNIQNLFLIEELEQLQSQEIISKEQLDAIKKTTITPKTNTNLLVRFAFFLLGNFAISSLLGFFALFIVMIERPEAFAFCFFIAAIGSVVVTEFIYKGNFFAYGFDDSFILYVSLFTTISIGIYSEDVIAILITFLLSAVFCTIRYVHVPSAFFSIVALIGLIGYSIIKENILPSHYLPVVLFLTSLGLYFFQNALAKDSSNFIYFNVLKVVKIMSLAIGNASLNYFVVRELSEMLLNLQIKPQEDIPLSFLFYIATFAIPLFYIFYGLKQKDRTFFWIGSLALALGFVSIRYYYYFLPIELALILSGTILFIIVYFSIHKLKNKEVGITFKEDKSINPMAFDLVRTILINANVPSNQIEAIESPMEFGGGKFSGGGSGGSF